MSKKIDFGYDHKTTGEDILKDYDLTGKHYFITGCNTGIGYETARVLYKLNATITMACRNEEKMKKAKERLEKTLPNAKSKIYTEIVNLASQKQLSEFIKEYKPSQKIDGLILNAGVMIPPYTLTEDGFELQMGVNHFGHFKLCLGLLKHLNENARIVVLSSGAHRWGFLEFNDLHWKTEKRKKLYNENLWKPYGQSKLANIVFAKELNRKLIESGKRIRANAVHPGLVPGSDLTRYNEDTKKWIKKLKVGEKTEAGLIAKSIPAGAATSLFVAVDKRLEGVGGLYFADCGEQDPTVDQANQKDVWKKLWEISEKECNIKYPF